ncbi:MAG: hypothetical protein K6E58_04240 [Eubacterium sp.]|nr:hypothetical protein [Eubacterium sp.]
MANGFDLEKVLRELRKKRKAFVSEADFQLALAWQIKQMYKDEVEVRCEYPLESDSSIHIDIVVIKKNKWIPIELKYKTKECNIDDNDKFHLKNHGAKDVGCYDYLKDISRIEKISKRKEFWKGYTVLLTNDLSYLKKPKKEKAYYRNFSLENKKKLHRYLRWDGNTSDETVNARPNFNLSKYYSCHWKKYTDVNTSDGEIVFKYLMHVINK